MMHNHVYYEKEDSWCKQDLIAYKIRGMEGGGFTPPSMGCSAIGMAGHSSGMHGGHL
jgi:hypothetical protein